MKVGAELSEKPAGFELSPPGLNFFSPLSHVARVCSLSLAVRKVA